MTEQNTVATPSKARQDMSADWQMIDDLLGGTAAMRSAGTRWLPKEEAESESAYRVRLNRSFLYGALKDTMRRIRAKPFSQPVKLAKQLEGRLDGLDKDVDGLGSDLTQFADACFDSAQKRGLVHILVDYPDVSIPGETPEQRAARVTLAEEQAIKPYFVRITADDMLDWEHEQMPGQGLRPSMIRFREWITEPDGLWGKKLIEQIRVLRKTEWETYRYVDADKAWKVHKQGTNSLGVVPISTAYFARTGFMTAEPPHVELAWLNVAHWCTSSDQNHILRFQRFGILFSKGFTKKENGDDAVIGPARWVHSESASADMKVVEGSGAAISAGRQDILDVEARMEVMRLQPLMERVGDATATARAIDESSAQNDVQAWIRQLESALLSALGFAHKWVGSEQPKDQAVDIFSEFGLSQRAGDDIKNLLAMRMANEITHRTFLTEIRRRALLSDSVDIEKELLELEGTNTTDGNTGMPGASPTDPHNHADPTAGQGQNGGAATAA